MHGYELRKRLNLMLGWGRLLSYGSLYPALKKMLRANLIVEYRTATPGAIATKRPRIVYCLTEHGEQQFVTPISEVGHTAWDDDNFDVRLRSDERRVGKECVSKCSSWWSPSHSKEKQKKKKE